MGKHAVNNQKKSKVSNKNLKAKTNKDIKKSNHGKIRESIFADSPIYDLFRTFEKAPNQWAARYLIVMTAIILKSAIGLGSYLGMGEKPINGDFEAQRHWMELTIHLPAQEWYFFDLQYWGLDYPPLTAYHLYFCGKIGSLIDPSWFALNDSRGIEITSLKLFMRITSLVSDLLIFMPPLLRIVSIFGMRFNISRIDQIMFSSVILYLPSLNLIDHGHFQFNTVMLGLFLFSLLELIEGHLILASIWFMLCINFKQMGLYYAPFIFTYILASLFTRKKTVLLTIFSFNITKLILVGLTVIITQLVVLSPFLLGKTPLYKKLESLQQILVRVFPFQRGLFEDKVSNLWSVTNLFIKYKSIFSVQQLTKLALIVTLVSLIPSNALLFYKYLFKELSPKARFISLIYGFSATSWSFYLFSFQVHEKSVLVPLIPSTLLFLLNDKNHISIIQWINNACVFSMFPLLKKDGLLMQYTINLFLSNWLISGFKLKNNLLFSNKKIIWDMVFILSYVAMLIYHILEAFVMPPAKYPDIWLILNTAISFVCFLLFWLWLLYRIYCI